jgi:hypothetical protein
MLLTHALRAVKKGGISFVGSSSADGSSGGAITITTPTGPEAGDLLVAFGYSASSGSLWSVDGGGWTITNATNSSAPRLTAFYFTHVSAASYVFRQNSSGSLGITLMAFRGGSVDVYSTLATAADPIVIPSVTATTNGSIQLVTAGGNSDQPDATPSGFTQIYLNTGSPQPDWGVYYKQNISAGSTGTVSISMSSGSSTSGMQFIVKPT